MAQCERCPYAVKGRPRHAPVSGDVPLNPVGVIVGEGPGREEVERNRVMVGSSSQLMDAVLAENGLKRHTLAMVYATACRAPEDKHASALEGAVRACRGYLLHQLRMVPDDTPVLAMGRAAVLALVGRDAPSMDNMRGFLNPKFRIPRNSDTPGD